MGRQAPGFGGVTPPGPGARAGPRGGIGLYVRTHAAEFRGVNSLNSMATRGRIQGPGRGVNSPNSMATRGRIRGANSLNSMATRGRIQGAHSGQFPYHIRIFSNIGKYSNVIVIELSSEQPLPGESSAGVVLSLDTDLDLQPLPPSLLFPSHSPA